MKVKELLQVNKAAAVKNLWIAKPKGQVDRDYNLHEVMTTGGQLKVSLGEYQKISVSAFELKIIMR